MLKSTPETERDFVNDTIYNPTEETSTTEDFQQETSEAKPPDQIQEVLKMIEMMMKDIQLLKENSVNKETNLTSEIK